LARVFERQQHLAIAIEPAQQSEGYGCGVSVWAGQTRNLDHTERACRAACA
jgi:hypothetical protein